MYFYLFHLLFAEQRSQRPDGSGEAGTPGSGEETVGDGGRAQSKQTTFIDLSSLFRRISAA